MFYTFHLTQISLGPIFDWLAKFWRLSPSSANYNTYLDIAPMTFISYTLIIFAEPLGAILTNNESSPSIITLRFPESYSDDTYSPAEKIIVHDQLFVII